MTEEQMEIVRLHMRDTYDVAPWEWDSGELELSIYELITKKTNIDMINKELTDKLDTILGCLIGSHTSNSTPDQQLENLITELKVKYNNVSGDA